MKKLAFLLISIFCINVHASNERDYSAYFLVTGKHLQCEKIYKSICVSGVSDGYEEDLNKLIIFFKSIDEDDQTIVKIQKNDDLHYKIISGSFNYDFKRKEGHGFEDEYSITIDKARKYNAVKDEEYLIDP